MVENSRPGGTMFCVVSGWHQYSRKFSMVKHSQLTKICKNCESFPPQMI